MISHSHIHDFYCSSSVLFILSIFLINQSFEMRIHKSLLYNLLRDTMKTNRLTNSEQGWCCSSSSCRCPVVPPKGEEDQPPGASLLPAPYPTIQGRACDPSSQLSRATSPETAIPMTLPPKSHWLNGLSAHNGSYHQFSAFWLRSGSVLIYDFVYPLW